MDSSQAIAERVRAASESGGALRIQGVGGWMSAGRPCGPAATLDVGALRGIVDYVPGDLTLTARAGTTLEEIRHATLANGQWLALDPPGGLSASLGAVLATATPGPLSSTIGRVRDLTLGVEVVTGTGEITRAGGRVVKNVAGFDLVRLQIGAWGSLGVITEVTVRLRGIPDCDETVSIALPNTLESQRTLFAALRSAAVAPLAMEVINQTLAQRLGLGGACILIRFATNQVDVHAQQKLLRGAGLPCDPRDSAVWTRLADATSGGTLVLRASALPSAFADLWSILQQYAPTAELSGTLDRGMVRLIDRDTPDTQLRAMLTSILVAPQVKGIVVETAPPTLWPYVPLPPNAELLRGIKRAFDPGAVLNPSIMGVAP